MRLRGTFTALITPFLGDRAESATGRADENAPLDEEGFRSLSRRQLAAGISGLVVNGSTGECPTLEPDEVETLIRIAAEEARNARHEGADPIPVIAGTGTYSTKRTILATRRARDAGADAALVVVPYYNKPSDEGLYRHFRAVAEEGGLPVIVYNIAGRTARNLSTDALERLATVPGIIGVKEGSGDIAQMTAVIERIGRERADFSVLSGDDAMAFPLIALGGDGLIATASNLVPERMIALVNAALDGDLEAARLEHFGLLPLFRALTLETNPGPIKEAMAMAGLPAGPLRPPLAPLEPGNRRKLRDAMLAAGLAPVVQESAA